MNSILFEMHIVLVLEEWNANIAGLVQSIHDEEDKIQKARAEAVSKTWEGI